MRTAVKRLMLATATLAALAFSATNASAQVSIENEATGDPCPALGAGGCHVEFESEEDVVTFAHITSIGEIPQSNCEIYLEARIGPDGEGFVVEASLTTPHDTFLANCVTEPCTTTGSMDPWPLHIQEHGPSGEEAIIRFCISPVGQMGTKTNCTLDLPLVQIGHMQEITATVSNRCAENPVLSMPGHYLSHEGVNGQEEFRIHHSAE